MTGATKRPVKSAGRPLRVRQVILVDSLNVTWRMAVPIIAGTLLGLWLDKKFDTKPWIMVACMLLGIWLAAILVLRQLKTVKQEVKKLNAK